MKQYRYLVIFFLLFVCRVGYSQADSSLEALQKIPQKYISVVDNKIERYRNQLNKKTEKTLSRLCQWEDKIRGILEKVSPGTAQKLFNENALTFRSLLQKIQDGEKIISPYNIPYNQYRDELETSLNYLAQQKQQLDSNIIKEVKETNNRMTELSAEEDRSAAIAELIKERKQELVRQSLQYIGQSKYLAKINKETYYYAETLKNYKELFADSRKAEETVREILNRIPAFQKFMQQNGQMAALFGQPSYSASLPPVAGLQTRAGIQALIQDQVASAGPNALQAIQQNMQEARGQLENIKQQMLSKLPGNGLATDLPGFRPNEQKTKTFRQRLEYGFNVQFAKDNYLLPTTSDIALTLGYKINNNSIAGIGATYKLGMGSIRHIQFSHQGIGMRSFIDWKIKGRFFLSGGYEWEHNSQFKNIEQLKSYAAWQRSALIGISQKLPVKAKWFKATNIQLLYDFLYNQQVPVRQPLVFRIGYTF